MLLATASQAAFDRSSSGRMMTWLRTPTRPLSRRQPKNLRSEWPFFFATTLFAADLPFFFDFFAISTTLSVRVPGAAQRVAVRCRTGTPVGRKLGPGSRFARPGHESAASPAFRFHVVDVDVLALADLGLGDADVLAVLPDRVALLDVGQRHLVADRNVHLRFQLEGRIVVSDDAQHVGALFQALNDDDADGVLPVVH